jgi:hypothetical protein
MTKPNYSLDLADLDLDPNEIFRPKIAEKYFGLKHTQINEKVRAGEIEAPFLLSEGGKAVGWTGRQIINYHRKRIAATAKKLETTA